MTEKNIIVAESAGFCWGVKRAMDMTLETAIESKDPVFTFGPLIHNPQVIEMLEKNHVLATENISEINEGRLIIRTHGITPKVRRDLKSKGLAITDATCPLVAKVQGIIKKHASRGFDIIIIGDRGHAEVIGLMGFASNKCHVVASEDDLELLPDMEKVCVVAQTTCDTTKYEQVVGSLLLRFPSAVIVNTICEATEERQQETRDIAAQVDLMVVVGGRNSANTNRLAQLARATGAVATLIESDEELDPETVMSYDTIGLTAGTSTPSWIIERVREKLEVILNNTAPTPIDKIKGLLSSLVIGNVSLALGSALMVLANSLLAGYMFSWVSAFIASSYIFSMYALNQLNDVQTVKHNEPKKIKFYLKWQDTIKKTSIFVTLLSLLAVLYFGPLITMVYVLSVGLGLAYTVKWFPELEWLPYHRLKDIPASKDVFVGLAWLVVTVLIPAMVAEANLLTPSIIITGFYTFGLVFIRSTLSDIRDIEGDKLVGRETIPLLIGKDSTKVFLGILTIFIIGLLFISTEVGWTTSFGHLFSLTALYTIFYLWIYHMRVISKGIRLDILLDGVFYVSGLLAIIWIAIGSLTK